MKEIEDAIRAGSDKLKNMQLYDSSRVNLSSIRLQNNIEIALMATAKHAWLEANKEIQQAYEKGLNLGLKVSKK